MVLFSLDGASIITADIPALKCQSIWQCISHTPGLVASNRIRAQPSAGTDTVSLNTPCPESNSDVGPHIPKSMSVKRHRVFSSVSIGN